MNENYKFFLFLIGLLACSYMSFIKGEDRGRDQGYLVGYHLAMSETLNKDTEIIENDYEVKK